MLLFIHNSNESGWPIPPAAPITQTLYRCRLGSAALAMALAKEETLLRIPSIQGM